MAISPSTITRCNPTGDSRYVVLVNRMARPGDTRVLSVTLRAPHDARYVTDVVTDTLVAQLDQGEHTFTLEMAPGDGRILEIGPCGPVACGAVVAAGDTLSLGAGTHRILPGASIVVRGTLLTNGTTLTAINPSQLWAGIAIENGSATLTNTTVGHADIGVTVYDPAWLHTDGSEFRHNRVGIDVLSPLNTGDQNRIYDTDFFENGTAVRSDFSACVGQQCSCLTSCRSRFTVENSCVSNSVLDDPAGLTGRGVWVRNADARLVASTVTANGSTGVWTDAAEIRLRENLLTWNGGAEDPGGDGTHALEGADLLLFDPFDVDGTGGNVVHHNAGDEVEAEDQSYVVAGLVLGGEGPPHNTITKEDAPGEDHRHIQNDCGYTIYSEDVWWGDVGGAPAAAFDTTADKVIDYPFLTSAPGGGAGDPGCPLPGASFTAPATGRRATAAAFGGGGPEPLHWREALSTRIRALRRVVETTASGPEAEAALREFYALQRLDRYDSLGERGVTMALIRQLRLRLAEPELSESERALSEVAALAEVHEALRAADYAHAADLAAWSAERASNPRTQYRLALAQVTLDEQARRYDDALARVTTLMANLPPEATEARRSLASRAAIISERAGRSPMAAVHPEAFAAAGTVEGAPTSFALGRPVPNPSRTGATVLLDVPTPALVRGHIYDVLGRRVATIVERDLAPGRHALRVNTTTLASGTYVLRVEARAGTTTRVLTHRLTVVR